MDKFSKSKRSEIMGRVKQKDTKPELIVRSLLHGRGFRFRLHRKDLPGKPDITLPKYRTVIFVHGCFWHGHNCSRGKLPETRKKFWREKIEGNRRRDISSTRKLKDLGFQVLIVWECETKDKGLLINQLTTFLVEEKNGSTVKTR